MDFYDDDATLVIKPGLTANGKDQIRRAFVAIHAAPARTVKMMRNLQAEHFPAR